MSSSRTTIGVLTGLAVVAVAAIPSLASSITPSGGTSPAVATTVRSTGSSSSALKAAAVKAPPKKTTPKKTTAPVVKTVRSVKLVIPVPNNRVGANVTGFIQVLDTTGKDSAPVPGVEVALEQQRGTKYVEIAGGTTDASGTYAIAFTNTTNSMFRAVLKPSTGKPVYGTVVKTTAVAQVTWAARPPMTPTKKTKVSYSFRVNPKSGTAQLQIASTKTPTKWLKTAPVQVPNAGVVTSYVVFPSAGTWLLRGATVASPSTGTGYTSNITVTVR